MADFFQSLSAIGDTLVKNRERNNRERTLADIGDLVGRGGVPDRNLLAAKLFAAGDIRGALIALGYGTARAASQNRQGVKPNRTRASPLSFAPSALDGPAIPAGITGAPEDDMLHEAFDAEPGSYARFLRSA
jgi:hypothetical protein